jgi:hypothetical protein
MIPARPYRLLLNRRQGTPGVVVLPDGHFRRARAEIESWPGYAVTPLVTLDDVAKAAPPSITRTRAGALASAPSRRLAVPMRCRSCW